MPHFVGLSTGFVLPAGEWPNAALLMHGNCNILTSVPT